MKGAGLSVLLESCKEGKVKAYLAMAVLLIDIISNEES